MEGRPDLYEVVEVNGQNVTFINIDLWCRWYNEVGAAMAAQRETIEAAINPPEVRSNVPRQVEVKAEPKG
jgi:hypothetical protein